MEGLTILRILSARVQNFSSYEELNFEFDDKGLVLVSGPTGAGKSTLCDIIPWILFGKTSKNGAVDDVLPWGSTATTIGMINVISGINNFTVIRTRNPNDLYFQTNDGNVVRGKDLKDTQKFIDNLLGCNLESYLAGAYLHEFSQSSMFFTAPAKIRKQITDNLVDLEFTNEISEKLSEYTKYLKKEHSDQSKQIANEAYALSAQEREETGLLNRSAKWESEKLIKIRTLSKDDSLSSEYVKFLGQKTRLESTISDLESQVLDPKDFEFTKANLQSKFDNLKDETCKECGAFKNNSTRLKMVKNMHALDKADTENQALISRLVSFKAQLKHHLESEPTKSNNNQILLEEVKKETNPYLGLLEDSANSISSRKTRIETTQMDLDVLNENLADSDTLTDLLASLRTKLVKSTISQLETNTNDLLTRYFDGELRVSFNLEDGDKLEVEITKDTNIANFTQLSKGQRQLLKLCLGLSIMKASSNANSVSFNVMFVDECTDGLSDDMKMKAYHLLESLTLECSSIFLVDHSETLKACANNQIKVELINGHSILKEA